MARNHSNPLDDPPAATSSEEHDEVEESEEEEEDDDQQQQHAQPDGSETEEGVEEEDEEEEEEEDEEDDEDDDEEDATKDKAHPQPSQSKPVSKIPNLQQDDDDDDDDTETDTESDADPKSPGVSAFAIKPHISKPAAAVPNSPASVKPKNPAAKLASKKGNASPMLVSLKRPAEAEGSKSRAKKVKAENGGGEEGGASEKKGGGVNRLWNEQDEVAILKGMIEFHDKKGVDPNSDSAAFHEFVKKDLSVDVSKSQLMDKVRRLKKKYRTNAGKGEKGQDPVFSRPHEAKAFELSKKVWGGPGLESRKAPPKKKNPVDQNAKPVNKVATDNGNAAIVVPVPKEESFLAVNDKQGQGKEQRESTFSELYPFLSMSLKKGGFGADLISRDWAEAMESYLMHMEKSKLEELEEEWKKQILVENDVYLRRSSLLQKQFQLLSDWRVERG